MPMQGLEISSDVEKKLTSKHSVTRGEVEQCFENCEGSHLVDTREQHQTDPQTLWFVAETNRKRKLKIVFIHKDGKVILKTAYDANPEEIRIYEKYGV